MMKLKVILADRDELYLANLSNYLMEKAPQLELYTFTKQDRLLQFLSQDSSADIVAADESMADPVICQYALHSTKIALTASGVGVEGFFSVKKYQKSEKLLNEILLRHAENTGSAEVVRGKSHTKLCAFYSPAGGTGKTTLSLALAAVCAKMGICTLYLNLEEIHSLCHELPRTPGTMSDVFLALQTKGMNAGVKLLSSVGREPENGFFYISGLESIMEYEEVSNELLVQFLGEIQELSEYDIVIIDMSSSFSEEKKRILEKMDIIFTPLTSSETAIAKLKRFLHENELHEKYHAITRKMNLVINQADVSGISPDIQESGIMDQLPCCTAIASSPLLMRQRDLLRSGDAMISVFGIMVQLLQSL